MFSLSVQLLLHSSTKKLLSDWVSSSAFKGSLSYMPISFWKNMNQRVFLLVTSTWTLFDVLKGPLGIKMFFFFIFNECLTASTPRRERREQEHFQKRADMFLGRTHVYCVFSEATGVALKMPWLTFLKSKYALFLKASLKWNSF